jgi:hypothetical protein
LPPDLSNCHQRLCRQRSQYKYLSRSQASTNFRGSPRKRNQVTQKRSQKNLGVAVGNHLRPPVWHSHFGSLVSIRNIRAAAMETPSREGSRQSPCNDSPAGCDPVTGPLRGAHRLPTVINTTRKRFTTRWKETTELQQSSCAATTETARKR